MNTQFYQTTQFPSKLILSKTKKCALDPLTTNVAKDCIDAWALPYNALAKYCKCPY